MTSPRRQPAMTGTSEQLGEPDEVGRRPGAEDAAAGEDHRPAGPRRGTGATARTSSAPVGAARARRCRLSRGIRRDDLVEEVLRERQENRAGPADRAPRGSRRRRRPATSAASVGSAARLGETADRRRPGRSPGTPRGRAARARPGRRARTSGVESWRRGVDADREVGGADGARSGARRRATGQLAVGLGHERGARPRGASRRRGCRAAPRPSRRPRKLAGHGERVPDAGGAEGVGDEPADGPRPAPAARRLGGRLVDSARLGVGGSSAAIGVSARGGASTRLRRRHRLGFDVGSAWLRRPPVPAQWRPVPAQARLDGSARTRRPARLSAARLGRAASTGAVRPRPRTPSDRRRPVADPAVRLGRRVDCVAAPSSSRRRPLARRPSRGRVRATTTTATTIITTRA